MIKFIKNTNKPGVTMVFVLMFMIIASILGSSLMYLSTKQSESGGDYFSKKSAEGAAESALDWFQGAMEDFTYNNPTNRDSIISWVNNFDNATDVKWYKNTGNIRDFSKDFASATTEADGDFIDVGNGKINAKLKIEKMDKTNNIIVLKAVGLGKNDSRKTIHAVYMLEGLSQDSIFGTTSGTSNYHSSALHLGGEGRNFDFSMNVDGDVYAGGNFHFNSGGGSPTTINGNFYTAPSTQESSIDQDVIIKGNSYIQSPLKMNGKSFNVEGNFATENMIYGTDKDKKLIVAGNAYLLNEGITTSNTGLDITGNLYMDQNNELDGDGSPFIKVAKNFDINYLSSSIGNMNGNVNVTGDMTYYDPNNKIASKMSKFTAASKTEDGVNITNPLDDANFFSTEFGNDVKRNVAQTQPEVREDNIDPAKIFKVSQLGLNNIKATDITNLYAEKKAAGKLNDGFLVIEVDQSLAWATADATTFNDKVMFIVKAGMNVNGNLWNSGPNSNTFFDIRSGTINGLGNANNPNATKFRGYVHVEGSPNVKMNWKGGSDFEGAMHFVGDDYDIQGNNGGGDPVNIKYDDSVLGEYDNLNVWYDPDKAQFVNRTDGNKVFKGIKSGTRTTTIKPKLISKY